MSAEMKRVLLTETDCPLWRALGPRGPLCLTQPMWKGGSDFGILQTSKESNFAIFDALAQSGAAGFDTGQPLFRHTRLGKYFSLLFRERASSKERRRSLVVTYICRSTGSIQSRVTQQDSTPKRLATEAVINQNILSFLNR